MKRTGFLIFIAILVLMVGLAGVANAGEGLLGKNYVGFRAGFIDLADFDENGSFGELRAQVAIEGNTPVDLVVSHMVAGTDNVDVWITRVGANIQIQQRDDMKIYGGGNYTFFEYETWSGFSDDDTFLGVHLGLEKGISSSAAIDFRVVLEDIGDEMDPQVYVELVNWFDDQFAGILGYGNWLDTEVSLLYAGLAISF